MRPGDPAASRAFEQELRRLVPQPEFEFLHMLQADLARPVAARAPSRLRAPFRVAAAAALPLGLAAALAATGNASFAASQLGGVKKIVQRVQRPQGTVVVRGLSAGGDQYRPGFGFGDPNHNHEGPPSIVRAADPVTGEPPPPVLQANATRDGLGATVTASVTFSEQAHLWLSVHDPTGRPLLLTQRSKRGGSRVGTPLRGPQAKFLQYALLVPRTVPITLRIPVNLLRRGGTYRLRIVAFDPSGNRTEVFLPFRL